MSYDSYSYFTIEHNFRLDADFYDYNKELCEQQLIKHFVNDCIRIGLTEDNIVSVEYTPTHYPNGELDLKAVATIKEL